MIIAVAGSDGFVGKYVCNTLEHNGHTLVKIDKTNGLDLSDNSIIRLIPKLDCFVHLANLVYVPASYLDPALFYRLNYLTTLNALEVCRKWDSHLVYISSYIYGPPQYLPVDENHPVRPFNPYAQSKFICEKLCEGYHRDFGVRVSILRPFNIYGVGQRGTLLIPEIISQLKEGKRQIHLKASSPKRDFINVIDVATAIELCTKSDDSFEIYNVCSGHSLSVREITEVINRNLINKVDFTFSISDRPNEVDDSCGSCEKLKALGWNVSIHFEEGIKQILKSENLL